MPSLGRASVTPPPNARTAKKIRLASRSPQMIIVFKPLSFPRFTCMKVGQVCNDRFVESCRRHEPGMGRKSSVRTESFRVILHKTCWIFHGLFRACPHLSFSSSPRPRVAEARSARSNRLTVASPSRRRRVPVAFPSQIRRVAVASPQNTPFFCQLRLSAQHLTPLCNAAKHCSMELVAPFDTWEA